MVMFPHSPAFYADGKELTCRQVRGLGIGFLIRWASSFCPEAGDELDFEQPWIPVTRDSRAKDGEGS